MYLVQIDSFSTKFITHEPVTKELVKEYLEVEYTQYEFDNSEFFTFFFIEQ